MNSKRISIQINDVFDELNVEIARLRTQLSLANKCIEILSEFKFFLDSIRRKLSQKLDQKLISTLSRLDQRHDHCLREISETEEKPRIRAKAKQNAIRRKHCFACDWIGCGFSTNRKSRLKAHSNYHSGIRPFKCGKCEKTFVGNESLKTHLKCVHKKRIQIKVKEMKRKTVLNLFADDKPFACSECQHKCRTRQALREHKFTHEERSVSGQRSTPKMTSFSCRTVLCEVCKKGFKNQKQMKSHARSHSSEPQFKCQVADCGAAFRTHKTLKIHISVKIGKKWKNGKNGN